MSNRLTIKGQVTIPKEIRDLLGLQEGNSSVEFSVSDDGSVTVRKANETVKSSRPRNTVSPIASRGVPPRRAHGGVLALLAGGL